MEQKFEKVEINIEKEGGSLLHDASESLLANLPIIILGMVIFLAIVREIIV